jgi:hypothetical protein
MCGGLQFKRRKPQVPGSLGLLDDEEETLQVLFPNPKAALLIDPDRNLWLPWGRRKEQPGDWPEGGWARAESLEKAYWTRWQPELVHIFPVRWMEKDPLRKSHWFELAPGEGILCLRLTAAPGEPLYVVTEPSHSHFREVHDRMPKVIRV